MRIDRPAVMIGLPEMHPTSPPSGPLHHQTSSAAAGLVGAATIGTEDMFAQTRRRDAPGRTASGRVDERGASRQPVDGPEPSISIVPSISG